MKEQLITFDTAKLAKKKGLNIELDVFNHIFDLEDRSEMFNVQRDTLLLSPDTWLLRHSQSLLQRWLRKVHNIHIKIDDFIDDEEGIEWDYEIHYIGTDVELDGTYVPLISFDITDNPMRKFLNYESALESALYESLEILNNE